MVRKTKNNTILYITILFAVIGVITFLIFGFSTQWTFQTGSNNSNSKSRQVDQDLGNPLQYGDNITAKQIANERVVIGEQGKSVEVITDDKTTEIDMYNSELQEDGIKQTYAEHMTKWHNEIRGQCSNDYGNTPDLKWNSELARQATEYSVKLAQLCTIRHDLHDNNKASSYGAKIAASENLAKIDSQMEKTKDDLLLAGKIAITGTDKTQSGYKGGWAGEGFNVSDDTFLPGKGYPPTCKEAASTGSGHYTAMNWVNSTDLGCGTSITDAGCAITVCHYADENNKHKERPYQKHGNTWRTMTRTGIKYKTEDERKNLVRCTEPLSLRDRDTTIFECSE